LILGAGDLPLPLVHIDDVVDAILNAAAGDLHGAEVIQIVGSQTLTQREVLAHAVGPGARTVRIPRWILPPLGAASQVILGALRRKSPVSPYRLRSALSYHRFESTRAGLLKGWSPRVTLQDGILQEVKRADGGSYNPAVTSASVARAAEPTPT
jgi:nucleoside-diphosphate-sugar epimerase